MSDFYYGNYSFSSNLYSKWRNTQKAIKNYKNKTLNLGNNTAVSKMSSASSDSFTNQLSDVLSNNKLPMDGYISNRPHGTSNPNSPLTQKIKIKNAFAYDGSNTKANSSDLQYKYVIDKPLSYTFGIAEKSAANSTLTGIGDYGTGRIDDYVAKYDSQGRLLSIKTSNSQYGNTEVTYTYSSNGEVKETSVDEEMGVIIETIYNSDKTIKSHSEYENAGAKERGESFITRNYTYGTDIYGNPTQKMVNSAGVTVVTTLKNGKYVEERTTGEDKIKDAFAYYSNDVKTRSEYQHEISGSFGDQFDISAYGEKNSAVTGKIDYGTGRIDDYVAKYDSQGRLSVIEKSNSVFGNGQIIYKYDEKGNMTETDYDEKTGVIIESTYNRSGLIQTHKEYESAEAKNKGECAVERNYSYIRRVGYIGYAQQIATNSEGKILSIKNVVSPIQLKKSQNARKTANSIDAKDLQYQYVIDKPLSYTFGIAEKGVANSATTGKGSYGTGRVDNYIATYDSQGRISGIKASNSTYGDTRVSYTYASNGEVKETSFDKSTGVIIETIYNSDKTIKSHSEYENVRAKSRGESFITRNYTYEIDKNGNPVQIMVNSEGVTVKVTCIDGKYVMQRTMS